MTVGLIFTVALVISLIATIILERKFIPLLMQLKMGQIILDIGPRWHKSKEGTPTMGGIFFIAPIVLITLAFGIYFAVSDGPVCAYYPCNDAPFRCYRLY